MSTELEVQVCLSSSSTRKTSTTYSKCRNFLFVLDGKKQHRPIFILIISLIHLIMYFLVSNDIRTIRPFSVFKLFKLGKFYLPCMRPSTDELRTSKVSCFLWLKDRECLYDDVLQRTCSSFLYPHQLWRFFTVNFFHLTWLHLLSNLSIQLVQGIPLERKYGSWRIALVYWISGLGASSGFIIRNREASGHGASGSLYGLMLFFIFDRLVSIRTNPDRYRFNIVQFAVLLLPHAIISLPFAMRYNVGHSAHVGGGLVGLLLAITMIGCPWTQNNEQCIGQNACRRLAIIFLILYFLLTFSLFFLLDVPFAHSSIHSV